MAAVKDMWRGASVHRPSEAEADGARNNGQSGEGPAPDPVRQISGKGYTYTVRCRVPY